MVSGKKRKEAEPATASGTKLGRRNQLANWASGTSLDGRGGSTEPTDPPPAYGPDFRDCGEIVVMWEMWENWGSWQMDQFSSS